MADNKQSHYLSVLDSGLQALGIELPASQQTTLINYLLMLKRWNKQINLTAITDVKQMIAYHLLDSLSIANLIVGEVVCDVGTGAGFPGVPLACYQPDKQFILLDSNHKKTSFIIQACATLRITNVRVVTERFEKFQPSQAVNTIVSRAVGDIAQLYTRSIELLEPQGRLILQKSQLSQQDLQDLSKFQYVSHNLSIPGVAGQRQALVFDNSHF